MNSKHKQEKVAEREAELIDIAHDIVTKDGFAGLTMDKLVNASPYSKGTIYNHFSSKEDLISALSTHSLSLLIEMFKKLEDFDGNSREHVLAVHFTYQLYCQLEPTLFLCVLSARTPAVMEKTSPERNAIIKKKELEVTAMCDHAFQQGLADGSLKLSTGVAMHDLVFASWATGFGTNALLINAKAVEGVSRLEQKYALLRNVNFLLDGMQWQPLSSEFDYHDTWKKLELFFADYLKLLEER
ncbi:TetR/AcrR family transcriptional regulator [Catenovulum sp. SM1970]|uniref:TetR/AcrR family transcriptional regulator n=1 Tax=Marinifaba aquimaris TaxID=2741323 RepID=UPI00157469EC|nr:TetR/AcrR family transcriptional regulator [Marinifaba aquimaris]NTS76837.1 TetR/AcrR family transcriptional regulator [Marinifaba aquimaris]